MTYRYKIYQLDPHDPKQLEKMFRSYDTINQYFGGINIDEYRETYCGILQVAIRDEYQLLGKIFEKFNINHPEDFHSHSLSVGDIVEIEDKKYYCDSFGWKKL